MRLMLTLGQKINGSSKINGNNYYFDSTTGVMKTGLMTLDGGTVYFSPQTGKMVYGLQKLMVIITILQKRRVKMMWLKLMKRWPAN
ncbi:hypothetical protein ACGO3R_12530 [Lactococcus lactis]